MLQKIKLSAVLVVLLVVPETFLLGQTDYQFLRDELDKYNQRWGYKVSLSFNQTNKIVSQSNGQIKVGQDELTSLDLPTNLEHRKYLLRFLLAHEFAHQIQYFRYRFEEEKMNNDLAARRIIETQADIIAGMIFMLESPELLDMLETDIDKSDEIMMEIFELADKLGYKENTNGTHPSIRERMLTIRLGVENGVGYLFDQRIKFKSGYAKRLAITPNMFRQLMDNHMEQIDLLPNEDLISWSYRQAKKIVNYDRRLATDIILETPRNQRHKFDTSSNARHVTYDLTYKNIGSKTLNLDFDVFVALKNRENPNSTIRYRRLNSKSYKFSLRPNESKRINGKMSWDKMERDITDMVYMRADELPSISYPQGTYVDAIYSIDDGQQLIPYGKIEELGLKKDIKQRSFKSFYRSIYNTFLTNKSRLIQGLGQLSIEPENSYTFLSSEQYTNDTQCIIKTDKNKELIRIEVQFPNYYPNSDEANSTFNELIEFFDEELGKNEKSVEESDWLKAVSYFSPKADVDVELISLNDRQFQTIVIYIWF